MACDLVHVDTILLPRLYVLVFIHHHTRLVRIARITSNPVTTWVTQQARNLSMELAEQASAIKFLIRDRDSKFTASFDAVFAAEGARIIKSAVRAPRANAICERPIGTIRRECLDRMLILARRHLEAVLADYVEHYNAHRPHRSLGQRPPAHSDATPPTIGDAHAARLRRGDRLGGPIHPVPDGGLSRADGVLATHRFSAPTRSRTCRVSLQAAGLTGACSGDSKENGRDAHYEEEMRCRK